MSSADQYSSASYAHYSTHTPTKTPLLTTNNTLWDAQQNPPTDTGRLTAKRETTWATPAGVSQLFDSTTTVSDSQDNYSDDERTDNTDGNKTLWADPAPVPSYILADALTMPTDDDTTTTTYTTAMSCDDSDTPWAEPAPVPSYILAEALVMPSDNDTTTTPNTTATTNQHTLWTTPTEPLPNCSTPSQPSAETQPLIPGH